MIVLIADEHIQVIHLFDMCILECVFCLDYENLGVFI